ncbi:MAG: hypothetical protein WCD73_24580 [Pseudolabrys sp.]
MLDASFGFKRSKVAGWRGDNGHATTHEVNHERRFALWSNSGQSQADWNYHTVVGGTCEMVLWFDG